jgi:hypothetical protein
MSIIKISKSLSSDIATKSQKIKAYHQDDIDNFLKSDDSFQHIFKSAKIVLEENYFVVIKNIGFIREKSIFESFVKLFGNFYGAVEYTDIKLDCPYTGCNYKLIELHNDDAVDLITQPLYGFIQIQNEDPLKLAQNGLVKVDDMINYLELYDKKFLNELLTTKINMLAYGVNYDGTDKKKILLQEPIFYKENDGYHVRFDLTRIKYFYWKENKEQSLEERLLIDRFLTLAKKFRTEIYLEQGDILIHNNKRTLHDRTECGFELDLNGTFNTREIFVSFVR